MACKEKVCAWEPCGRIFVPNVGGQKYCCEHCKHESDKLRYRERNATAGGPKKVKKAKVKKTVPEKFEEDADMRDPISDKCDQNDPVYIPKPRCKLERDVLAARRAGMSYGQYMARGIR